MQFLADTHCFLWWHENPGKLGNRYREIIADPTNNILISSAVVWEISLKYTLKKLHLPEPPGIYIPTRIKLGSFNSLAITLSHALQSSKLKLIHKDPFDRMLVSQSQVEDIPILSRDKMIARYDVNVVKYE